MQGDLFQLSIDRSVATPWNECGNTGKVLQRYTSNFLQCIRLDKSLDKFVQSVYLKSEWTGCEVELRSIEKRRMRLKACHHYIWKSQRWKL